MRITETQFIRLLQKQAASQAHLLPRRTGLRQGIGDDCAVLSVSARKDLLVTTDLFIENVHFLRRWQNPRSVGYKTLARGLSDIAAMGGIPRFAFLSLGLPAKTNEKWLRDFFHGFFTLAGSAGVVLAGGDTGRSRSDFFADIIVTGEAPAGTAVMRSGARPGDQIWVTGHLGLAAWGLRTQERTKREVRSSEFRRFFFPEPRINVGRFLRERKFASAMMDISDGLSLDLSRLCEASCVGAKIKEANIPRRPDCSLRDALQGGEDLELLFTVSPRRAGSLPPSIDGVRLTCIGEIVPQRGLVLVRRNRETPLPVQGFQHF